MQRGHRLGTAPIGIECERPFTGARGLRAASRAACRKQQSCDEWRGRRAHPADLPPLLRSCCNGAVPLLLLLLPLPPCYRCCHCSATLLQLLLRRTAAAGQLCCLVDLYCLLQRRDLIRNTQR